MRLNQFTLNAVPLSGRAFVAAVAFSATLVQADAQIKSSPVRFAESIAAVETGGSTAPTPHRRARAGGQISTVSEVSPWAQLYAYPQTAVYSSVSVNAGLFVERVAVGHIFGEARVSPNPLRFAEEGAEVLSLSSVVVASGVRKVKPSTRSNTRSILSNNQYTTTVWRVNWVKAGVAFVPRGYARATANSWMGRTEARGIGLAAAIPRLTAAGAAAAIGTTDAILDATRTRITRWGALGEANILAIPSVTTAGGVRYAGAGALAYPKAGLTPAPSRYAKPYSDATAVARGLPVAHMAAAAAAKADGFAQAAVEAVRKKKPSVAGVSTALSLSVDAVRFALPEAIVGGRSTVAPPAERFAKTSGHCAVSCSTVGDAGRNALPTVHSSAGCVFAGAPDRTALSTASPVVIADVSVGGVRYAKAVINAAANASVDTTPVRFAYDGVMVAAQAGVYETVPSVRIAKAKADVSVSAFVPRVSIYGVAVADVAVSGTASAVGSGNLTAGARIAPSGAATVSAKPNAMFWAHTRGSVGHATVFADAQIRIKVVANVSAYGMADAFPWRKKLAAADVFAAARLDSANSRANDTAQAPDERSIFVSPEYRRVIVTPQTRTLIVSGVDRGVSV